MARPPFGAFHPFHDFSSARSFLLDSYRHPTDCSRSFRCLAWLVALRSLPNNERHWDCRSLHREYRDLIDDLVPREDPLYGEQSLDLDHDTAERILGKNSYRLINLNLPRGERFFMQLCHDQGVDRPDGAYALRIFCTLSQSA
jgi:hypothetical protein